MILNLALLILYNTGISDDAIPKELRLYLVILLRLALAFESRVTRNVILSEYLKETLIYTGEELKKSLRLWAI